MFIGDTGIARVTRRTLEVMKELGTDDPETVRKAGAIDLPTIQKYMNFWFSSALDLFGSESSSNAALYFASGLKGRPDEATYEDHSAANDVYKLESPEGGGVKSEEIPMRNAMNDITRLAYVRDCEIGMTRWNRTIERAGYDFRYTLPSTRFRRSIGVWANFSTDPKGNPISVEQFEARKNDWLPTEADRAFVHSMMQAVTEPGKMAAWIAPPDRGINSNTVDYEYVRLA